MKKKFRNLSLGAKVMITIGAALVVLTAFDVWFSTKKEKDIMYKDIKKWTFVFAENVRTTLNTLMREDKMDIRFSMLDAMSKEISGVEHVRIIRGPKVDEGFRLINEQELIPREMEAINAYKDDIARLEGDLKATRDPDERAEIKEEIEDIKGYIADSEDKITKARIVRETDPREVPKDDLDREVLATGQPIYHFAGDKGRVLIPYIAQKTCSTTSGCHKMAKEGDVLGAISMEFSIADIQKDIVANNLKTAGVGAVRLAIILGILSFFMSVFVIRNVRSLLAGFNRISGGDFSTKLKVESEDEMGKLARGFNSFVDRFNGMIGEIQDATVKMAVTSEELSASSTQIVNGTDAQKAKTAQVATASEELSATINEVAGNTHGAAEAAKKASSAARMGADIVAHSINGMSSIVPIVNESSETISKLGSRSAEIGKIVGVINDIADQTNLLALNAAIEAARAGEQGRGFAVVADEVKKLAERTTLATKEISFMIKAIQEDTKKAIESTDKEVRAVEEASGYAKEAGVALDEILLQVEQVSVMVQQIAAASEQQSTAAGQISRDIEAVAEVAKSRADDVGHVADAAVDLAKLSARLKEMISLFKTAHGEKPDAPPVQERPVERKRKLALVK
ncbi:MAG: methyl-accepting chemotaxis protein [Deltaproteobacteria bacterium]|nr:methyl-accepting chemotaxis protein [Deltaproteobacteria bacterium]MBZ0219946.1 methyl-accepting chemotaxis protein [Deltaproteobacteria bacterium]